MTQDYFWTLTWLEREREADNDLQYGDYTDYDNMDDLILDLKDD